MKAGMLTVALVAVVFVIAGCGSKPTPVGEWKNQDGNLLTLAEKDAAYLGQEGYESRDTGTYKMVEDVITISTRPVVEDGNAFFNMYVLRNHGDSLSLLSIKLIRGSDTLVTTADQLATRMGRSPSTLVFHRIPAGS